MLRGRCMRESIFEKIILETVKTSEPVIGGRGGTLNFHIWRAFLRRLSAMHKDS